MSLQTLAQQHLRFTDNEEAAYMLDMTPEDEKPATDPANPLKRTDAPMIVHENEPERSPMLEKVAALALPKLNTRITASFAYEPAGQMVRKLLVLANMTAGDIDDGPDLSPIRFEDEPLYLCVERILHLVGGSWSVEAETEAFSFKVD